MFLAVIMGGCTASSGRDMDGDVSPPRLDPWSQRPVVELFFDVAEDLRTVAGREKVAFTPDLGICELVFRAWPNKPATARTGSSLTVTRTTVDSHTVTPRILAGGAAEGAPGTVIEVPLPRCIDAGGSVIAEISFRVALGNQADERMGHSSAMDLAWFATAFPLLAWERERGWAPDPAERIAGETVTSEEFRLAALEVEAPSRFSVFGTGVASGTRPGDRPRTTSHRFTADAVRDVAVSVGRLRVLDEEVSGARLHVAAPHQETAVSPDQWAQDVAGSMRRLSELLGPFPYPDLWVTIIPDQTEGIEFPGAIQFGNADSRELAWLVSHEIAHMWFYGLVGNNQARDPWLDEAFATFAQAVVDDQEEDYRLEDVRDTVAGKMGRSMAYWANAGGSRRYTQGVYDQGAAVLLEARRRVGSDRFDDALRSYVNTNAHQIATPADVQEAFRALPTVVNLLRQAGAFSGD